MPPSGTRRPAVDPTGSRHGRAVCEAAVTLASTARADAIVAVTREGNTARLLAALRPSTQVFAVTPSADVVGASAVLWGVTPLLTTAQEIDELERLLVERRLVSRGSVVVFVNVSAELNRTDANFINVQRFLALTDPATLFLPEPLHVGDDRPDLLGRQLILLRRHLRAAPAVHHLVEDHAVRIAVGALGIGQVHVFGVIGIGVRAIAQTLRPWHF